jgi:hypothetical protein
VYDQGLWDEDRVGMNVIKKWNPWDEGGPIVFHSEWWIREHWGRAFEILSVERSDPDDPEGQGAALLRPRRALLNRAKLERPGEDPRELAALRRNIDQLHREAKDLFLQLEAEVGRLREELARVSRSRSWRLTAPLRATMAALRRRRV